MTLDEIKNIIEAAIPRSTVYVRDPMNDGQHLQAIVISDAFDGIMLIRQHQMVMRPLTQALAGAVHALSLKTFTPDKWKEVREKYNVPRVNT